MLKLRRPLVLLALLSLLVFAVANPAGLAERAAAGEPATRPTTAPIGPQAGLDRTWEGFVVSGGCRRGFVVRLTRQDGNWAGTIAAPAWGTTPWPLSDVSVEGKRLTMKVGPADARPGAFVGTIADGAIEGSYFWQGESFAFTMGTDRIPEAHRRLRPQFPEPPLPYDTEPVSFRSGDLRLSGGLTIPRNGGRRPAILLIGGSGGSRWHPDIPGDWEPHLALAVWADRLARAGIVTLRTDSRGLGGSSGNKDDSTLSELADDALAGVRFLRSREEVEPGRVGIFGISEGAAIAAIAAVRSDHVQVVVRLSGLGVPGDEGKLEQIRRISHVLGVDRHIPTEPHIAWERHLNDLCESYASASTIRKGMERWEAQQRAEGKPVTPVFLADAVREASTPLMRSRLRYDPRRDLRLLTAPVLDLHGEKDIFVPTDQSVPEIKKALKESGNPDATVLTFPGLDHFMEKSESGYLSGDAMEQDVVDPGVLHFVTEWVSKHVSLEDKTK